MNSNNSFPSRRRRTSRMHLLWHESQMRRRQYVVILFLLGLLMKLFLQAQTNVASVTPARTSSPSTVRHYNVPVEVKGHISFQVQTNVASTLRTTNVVCHVNGNHHKPESHLGFQVSTNATNALTTVADSSSNVCLL